MCFLWCTSRENGRTNIVLGATSLHRLLSSFAPQQHGKNLPTRITKFFRNDVGSIVDDSWKAVYNTVNSVARPPHLNPEQVQFPRFACSHALAGPWWLVTDDLRLLFRMWSTPVHRWLAACIYRPILQLGTGMKQGPRKVNGFPMTSHSSRATSLDTSENENKTEKRDGKVESQRDGGMSKR